MLNEIRTAYDDSLWMLEDGIRRLPDEKWRQGPDDYLIPARIAYHIFKGLEWLINELPPEEFKRTRRYALNWLDSVAPMPSQADLLADLPWLRGQITIWLDQAEKLDPCSAEGRAKAGKALYFLRHTQHHVGEFSIICRLVGCDSPEWK